MSDTFWKHLERLKAQGKVGGNTVAIFPAWEVGDKVLHKPSGITGTVRQLDYPGGLLVKVNLVGHRRTLQCHAGDLVLAP